MGGAARVESPPYGQRLHPEGKINTVEGALPSPAQGERLPGGKPWEGVNTGGAWWGEDLRAPCALRANGSPTVARPTTPLLCRERKQGGRSRRRAKGRGARSVKEEYLGERCHKRGALTKHIEDTVKE